MNYKFDISVYIKDLGEDLLTIFERSSRLGNHPDEIGRAKEINITKQIESILPSGVGIGRGFVIDALGNVSNQCDLILYEKNLIPVFIRDSNEEYSYFPCEGVIAVGEIKSTLNTNELEISIEKLNKIKGLKRMVKDPHVFRQYLSTINVYGTDSEMFDPIEKSYDNIFTFIFCKNNNISENTLLSKLVDEYSDCMELGIDRIYSQNKPVISRFTKFDNKMYLRGDKKGIGFGSLKVNSSPFGVLVKDISDFVSNGRSQEFNLRSYYDIGDIDLANYQLAKKK